MLNAKLISNPSNAAAWLLAAYADEPARILSLLACTYSISIAAAWDRMKLVKSVSFSLCCESRKTYVLYTIYLTSRSAPTLSMLSRTNCSIVSNYSTYFLFFWSTSMSINPRITRTRSILNAPSVINIIKSIVACRINKSQYLYANTPLFDLRISSIA